MILAKLQGEVATHFEEAERWILLYYYYQLAWPGPNLPAQQKFHMRPRLLLNSCTVLLVLV